MKHGYLYELLRRLGLSVFGASTGEFLLVRPLRILAILLVAAILSRIGARAARRFVRGLHARAPLKRATPRSDLRAATVGDVLASLLRIVVGSVAVLLVLDEVGLDLAPLLAGAGIAGVAIGFGAQSLVKDFLSGLFILLEDQYGVGDSVVLGDTSGTVEDVTLRITRVRAVDGTVWYIPNGELRRVGNASIEWATEHVDVLVAYDTDVVAVTAALDEEAAALAEDPAWHDDVLEQPEVWGIHAMGADGVTVRVSVKTAPGRQKAVARALRARINARLRRDGVKMPGGPTLMVTSSPPSEVGGTPAA